MALLQIRDVSEQARRELKARAAARGESLNSYLLDLLEREVARPTVQAVLDRAARRAGRAAASSVDVVREDRDGRAGRSPRRSS